MSEIAAVSDVAGDEGVPHWLTGRDTRLIERAADEFDFNPEALHALALARSLSAVVAQYEAALWRGIDLTPAQGWLVMKLMLAGSLTQSEIASDLLVTRSSVSQLADRLEALGLVARKHSDHDRRVIQLTLTIAGRQKVSEVLPTIRAALAGIASRINPSQLAGMLGSLDELARAVGEAGHESLESG